MKKKRNYDITHRVVRVIASDYAFLVGISQRSGVSMSEALHFAITRQIPEIRVSPPKAAFRIAPVTNIGVNGSKRVALVIKPKQPAIVVNGSKYAAFKIKPKGGVIYEREL